MDDLPSEPIDSTDQQPDSNPPAHTDWHLLLGAMQEALLSPVGIEVHTEILASLKPPRLDILLLRRKGATWTPEQQMRLPDGIRQSQARHILCEFKYTQSVNQAALVQAVTYDQLYRSSRKLKRQDVATFVISAKTPQRELLGQFGYMPSRESGVYRSDQPILREIILVVLNQLSNELHNAFFRCFASQRKTRNATFALLDQVNVANWSPTLGEMVAGLYSVFQVQEEDEMKEIVITPEYIRKLGKEAQKTILATVPSDQRLLGLAPEERMAGLAPEERMAGLAPEERMAGLAPEERMAGLDLAVIEAYLRQRRQEEERRSAAKQPTTPRKKKAGVQTSGKPA
jgi:hypothetical protein